MGDASQRYDRQEAPVSAAIPHRSDDAYDGVGPPFVARTPDSKSWADGPSTYVYPTFDGRASMGPTTVTGSHRGFNAHRAAGRHHAHRGARRHRLFPHTRRASSARKKRCYSKIYSDSKTPRSVQRRQRRVPARPRRARHRGVVYATGSERPIHRIGPRRGKS